MAGPFDYGCHNEIRLHIGGREFLVWATKDTTALWRNHGIEVFRNERDALGGILERDLPFVRGCGFTLGETLGLATQAIVEEVNADGDYDAAISTP